MFLVRYSSVEANPPLLTVLNVCPAACPFLSLAWVDSESQALIPCAVPERPERLVAGVLNFFWLFLPTSRVLLLDFISLSESLNDY